MKLMEFTGTYVQVEPSATLVKQPFRVPTSRTELMAMLIHKVELLTGDFPRIKAEGTYPYFFGLSSREPLGMLPLLLNEPGSIAYAEYNMIFIETALTNMITHMGTSYTVFYYDPPVLVARDTLWLSGYGEYPGFIMGLRVKVGYTLEKVPERDFINALVD